MECLICKKTVLSKIGGVNLCSVNCLIKYEDKDKTFLDERKEDKDTNKKWIN